MELELPSERPADSDPVHPVQVVLAWIAKRRAARAQQQALTYLLALDPHRLDDLGINRADLFDARSASPPTRLLVERRAARGSGNTNP